MIVSDQDLHDMALGFKPVSTKVANICADLLSTRADLSALQEQIEKNLRREQSLLNWLKQGKKIKADSRCDFDRYIQLVNAGYVDGLISSYEIEHPLPTPPEAGTK